MSELDIAFEKVRGLVETFQSNISHYKTSKYSEDQARKDFIDKFWIALGWDVNHDKQTNPYEQEVKVERPVATKGSQRRADYAFFLAPNYHDVKFLVEAKKPSVDIENKENYFQLIRYGWNSDTPLAALTDFEQFHILDCRFKPDLNSALNQVRWKYYFTDYTNRDKFDKIYWLFSREAVADGSIEKRAKELPRPRGRAVQRGLFPGGYQSIDESFLDELDDFRKSLARNFKNHNPKLDSETLTELAQRTIDRLVFLRFLEDKGIEPQRIVERFGEKGTVWEGFTAASRRLNDIYNGIVYREHDILDSKDFNVDDKDFARICDDLAHVNSPYDFNAIPIHILGSIYERFLGKVIVATAKRAKVEEKPEVRKAGGVYYTPQYIVRYIVEHTVGKLIAGKTPDQIAKMRFADIACGSGSFLLGIFDQLLNYHGRYYNENPGKARKGDCIKRDGKLYLSLAKKREVLLNNIYGVDIDAQAVEVCQLSLYLKLLEDETEASAQQYLLDFAHVDKMKKLLPDLSKNIRCGNSLIGPDYYENQQADLFDATESKRINAFDWESKEYGFGEIMAQGGFDAVIGNPPYIRMEEFKNIKAYLRNKYCSHAERSDIYAYFIEREHKLLKNNGRFGMIVSNKFLRAKYGKPLREFLRQNATIERIVDFAGLPVFKGATVRTIVIITSRGPYGKHPILYSPPLPPGKFNIVAGGSLSVENAIEEFTYEVSPQALKKSVWGFSSPEVDALLGKLKASYTSLNEYCKGQICMGVKSGLTEAFVINESIRKKLIKQNPETKKIIKPFLNGRDVQRYYINSRKLYLIYTFHGIEIDKYPAVEAYLQSFKAKLKKRATRQEWYELQQPQYNFSRFMESPKIIFPDIATTPRFALDFEGYYGSNTTYFIPRRDLYLLGLLNSKIGNFYFSSVCAGLEGQTEIYLRFFGQYLEGFPIRTIDFNNKDDKANHERIVELVEHMLELNKKLHERKHSERERELLERQIDYTDRKIDKLVYELYNLTDNEIEIIEGS